MRKDHAEIIKKKREYYEKKMLLVRELYKMDICEIKDQARNLFPQNPNDYVATPIMALVETIIEKRGYLIQLLETTKYDGGERF